MSDSDKKTMQMIDLVKKKKAEIKNLERADWKTHCSFSFSPDRSNPKNLHTVKDVNMLIAMAGFLLQTSAHIELAAKAVGVDKPDEFKWLGHNASDWIADIKTRVGQINLADKKQKLSKLEGRLDKIISPELKAELELAEIEAELEDD